MGAQSRPTQLQRGPPGRLLIASQRQKQVRQHTLNRLSPRQGQSRLHPCEMQRRIIALAQKLTRQATQCQALGLRRNRNTHLSCSRIPGKFHRRCRSTMSGTSIQQRIHQVDHEFGLFLCHHLKALSQAKRGQNILARGCIRHPDERIFDSIQRNTSLGFQQ